MPSGINFPTALDTAAQFPDVGPTDQENALVGTPGLYHDELLTNHSRALLAIESYCVDLAGQLMQLASRLGAMSSQSQINKDAIAANAAAISAMPDASGLFLQLQARIDAAISTIAKNAADILALQSAPAAFDESRLFSRDARLDVLASQVAILQTAAPSTGSADPLQIYLNAQVFGS